MWPRLDFRRTRQAVFAALALVAISFAASSAYPGDSQPHWTVDLARYYPPPCAGDAKLPYVTAKLAATDDYVAVDLEFQVGCPKTPQERSHAGWQHSMIVFKVNDGMLFAKCGPWDGHASHVWATNAGNFLQTLEDASETHTAGQRLRVLSPSCQILHDLALEQQAGSVHQFLISPSNRTLLIVSPSKGETEYQLYDADSLTQRVQWVAATNEPKVSSVSDDGLLGVLAMHPGSNPVHRENGTARVFYREFSSPQWREIPHDGPYGSPVFLSNELFLEKENLEDQRPCAANVFRLRVRRLTGETLMSTEVAKRDWSIYSPTGPFAIAADGSHFGSLLNFTGVGWFWCALDMAPEHDTFYIWAASSSKPLERLSAQRPTFEQPAAFGPDGSWFVIKKESSLSLRPVEDAQK